MNGKVVMAMKLQLKRKKTWTLVVDSTVYQDVTGLSSCQINELEDYAQYATEETSDVNEILDFAIGRDIDDDLKYDLAEVPQSSFFLAPVQTQDGSGTACDAGVASGEVKTGIDDRRAGNQNDLSNGCSHGYALEPCDAKVWDSGIL